MGRIAAETLLGRIRSSEGRRGGEIIVKPELMARETTCRAPQSASLHSKKR
jgi:DNA-binding LacI/PurR family transcriptional regulator